MEEINKPIIAWRCWTVDDIGYLRSFYKHEVIWIHGEPMISDFSPSFSSSHGNIRYGIHAFKELDDLLEYAKHDIFQQRQIIIGQVYLWGQISEHQKGYRARYAYPKSVIVFNIENFLDIELNLRNSYGCEIIQNLNIDKMYSKLYFNKERKLHKDDGPAVIFKHGNKYWFKNGELHRENGPAVETEDGRQEWYQNGKLHREDGPAFILANGAQYWYKNGKLSHNYQPSNRFNPINWWFK